MPPPTVPPLLIFMAIPCVEEKLLIVLGEHYHASLRNENMFLDYHLSCNSVKALCYLRTQMTTNPGLLVNFLCPTCQRSVSTYVLISLSLASCVHWIPLTFPNLLFWPKTPAGGVGRGKRRALGKKLIPGVNRNPRTRPFCGLLDFRRNSRSTVFSRIKF